ncbi:GNAT family N-acetyltransferase [Teredinibacter sp. KSP-S5-2]|uniref:GNAT family N-acetyltransferase n=1 Tax=Teredinibacter sp. KSP-S5-2 TaxID=3034506 RepID=UPI0029345913|nr:GNAT family N-acetyltransferase [Teredinibacter sp. KSP-S5-2]WNO09297.1 GNAT family N-acetyltransferase [Teredinibacter sp. KSP-S5-2]
MSSMNLEKENLFNLVSLWKLMGAKESELDSTANLYRCSMWPNKHWLEGEDLFSPEPGQLKASIDQSHIDAVFPVWGSYDQLEAVLKQKDFVFRSEQIAMYVELASHSYSPEQGLVLREVKDAELLKLWGALGSSAFGYQINFSVMEKLLNQNNVIIEVGYYADHPVATVLSYVTGDVLGIHQVGVVSDMRGKQIASKIMHAVLSRGKKDGVKYATLQASPLGINIYKRLGFQEQFVIRNFQRDNQEK